MYYKSNYSHSLNYCKPNYIKVIILRISMYIFMISYCEMYFQYTFLSELYFSEESMAELCPAIHCLNMSK